MAEEAAPVLHGQLFQPRVRLDDEGADGQGGVEAREDAPLQAVDPCVGWIKINLVFFRGGGCFKHSRAVIYRRAPYFLT